MDQENTLDFQALRAKFQNEEVLQKQPKIKPALPDKPKQVPPPQSPVYYIPAGAQPSLLTSINQSLEAKTPIIPRVVFKDDKKESKMPLIQTNSKGKDKSEGKLKTGKDKSSKSAKAKSDDASSAPKQKKESSKDKRFSFVLPTAHKDSAAELVPATAPPKSTKKGFMGFKKSKRGSLEITADPILDSRSPDIYGPAPLIPVTSGFNDTTPQTDSSAPKVYLPDTPTSPEASASVDVTPPPTVPDIPDFSPPPAFIPETPAFKWAAPESKAAPEVEVPAVAISTPAIQREGDASPPGAVLTTPSSLTATSALPALSTPALPLPTPEAAFEAGVEAVNTAAVAAPPAPADADTFFPPSPKTERSISALSALERAEDMSPGKRTPPGDQRILNALEKARRKAPSPLTTLITSDSITAPPEEQTPPPQSPTDSLPELPPIDYEDRAGSSLPPAPAQVNSHDHPQASPLLEGIAEEEAEAVPELLVIPPPAKRLLPDRSSLGPPPEKPQRPSSVHLSEFIAPPPTAAMQDDLSSADLPVSAEVPETDETKAPMIDDVASEVESPNLPLSDLGDNEYTGADAPDGQTLAENYSYVSGAPAVTEPGEENQDRQPLAGSEGEVVHETNESTENVYEDVGTLGTKKKGKTDGGKKRKGPPKNPYVEAAQITNEEKTKTGWFDKGEKKAAAEGPDEKELKKKEKQRLEKEKRELKEKQEREKKEQKEREKKENEMKKTFKVTGHEDVMYQAKVTVTTKGRKHDLPVKNGDVVSIIRTTNCPKGKWLARDSSSNYGYVAVEHVELDIREMVELGRKTTSNRLSGSHLVDGQAASTANRVSNHYPLPAESFSDDSEEWVDDDDDNNNNGDDSARSGPTEPLSPTGHARTFSMPNMGNKDLSVNHQHSYSDMSADAPHVQNEALQKLSTFFKSAQPAASAAADTDEYCLDTPASGPCGDTPDRCTFQTSEPNLLCPSASGPEEAAHPAEDPSPKELDFEHPEMLILPPPDLYA